VVETLDAVRRMEVMVGSWRWRKCEIESPLAGWETKEGRNGELGEEGG